MSVETLWFYLTAIMLAAYVVLDGFDLGAGIVHYCVARNEKERRIVLRSIGPVWNGNEVWLLAAGGTLFLAFPAVYASSFSGFYLGLMMLLWLLILRGLSIEFRSYIDDPVWKPFWDAGFTGSSALLAIIFGVALGNIVRGVPLDASGQFFLPLWTDFGVKGELGIFDWYTVSVAALAFLTLAQHGALWIAMKTDGDVQRRARRVTSVAWVGVTAMTIIVTALTVQVQPQVSVNLANHVQGYVLPALAFGGLLAIWGCQRARRDVEAFLASCAYILAMLASAAFGVFPYLLPARPDPSLGLTIQNAATGSYGLKVALAWWIPGMVLTVGYFVLTYRHFAGKSRVDGEGY